MKIQVLPPDPSWPQIFELETQRLRSALHGLDIEVHHIGSTSIRGIHAKPVIDMLLIVSSLTKLDARAKDICALGYEEMGEFGIPERRYFRKDSPEGVRTHQVHCFEKNSTGEIRHLAFRDYMNTHPHAAKDYSDLKQQLARKFPFDSNAYISGKNDFVKRHEALALEWRLEQSH